MGGMVAQEMLRQARPGQFWSVTLISTVAGGVTSLGLFALTLPSGVRLLGQTMMARSNETRMRAALGILFEDDWLKLVHPDPLTGKPVTNADAFVRELERRTSLSGDLPPHQAWSMLKQTMAVSLHSVSDRDLARIAAGVRGNVVVITGDADILVHPWNSYRLARKLGVEPVVMHGARHGANEQFAADVNERIERNVAAGRAAAAAGPAPRGSGSESGSGTGSAPLPASAPSPIAASL